MSDVGKKIVNGLKEAASGKRLMRTVFCPKCGHRKRAEMSVIRLFGTQRCPACQHEWIPPRAQRKD